MWYVLPIFDEFSSNLPVHAFAANEFFVVPSAVLFATTTVYALDAHFAMDFHLFRRSGSHSTYREHALTHSLGGSTDFPPLPQYGISVQLERE